MMDALGAVRTNTLASLRNFLPGLLLGLSLLAPAAATAGTNLDPFARPTKGLSPFQVSRAESVPAPTPAPTGSPKAVPSKEAEAKACTIDEECGEGTICDWGKCVAIERGLDVLLYRQHGNSTAFLPFYWSRHGNPGYRILAPFYFHTWSAEAHNRIVAPFYWRFENYLKKRVVTVIGLYSKTQDPESTSHAVWPLFYYSSKFGWAAPLLLSFALGDPENGTQYGMVTPLSFWKRSKDSSFTWLFPLNFHWRNKDDRNILALPLFYRNTHKHGGTFASLLGYSSVDREATRGSFLWLYWYGREKASQYDVLFPILWSFRSPDSNVTILPPVLHLRDGHFSIGTAGLLAWWGSNEKTGTNWQFVPPVLFRKSSDHGKKAFYLWPLGSYRRDDNTHAKYFTQLFPPILHYRDASHALDFDILYYRHRDRIKNTQTLWAGPYYAHTDPSGATRSVLGLFWHWRDTVNDATAHALFPFYFHRKNPDETLTAAGVLPVLFAYHRSYRDGGSSAGLFPLVFWGSRGPRSHTIVAPFYWRFKDEASSTTVIPPLYYATRDKQQEHFGLPPLLYFSGRNAENRYRVQFPFLFQVSNDDTRVSTTLSLLYFRYARPEGTSSALLPLAFWGSGATHRHFMLFPVFGYFRDDTQDRTTTFVGPYLHRRHGGETTDAFFPLFHYRRGARPGGADETSLTLFPLFHYRRDKAGSLVASPVGIWSNTPERQVGFLGPYVWYRDKKVAAQAIPLLFLDHTQLDTQKRTRMWGPVIALDSPTERTRVVFPFFARYKTQTDEGTYVFPSFFHRRTTDGYTLTTLLPLFWRSRWKGGHTSVYGPYFSHTSSTNTSSGLLPLYVASESAKSKWLVTPAFVSRADKTKQEKSVYSLLYYANTTPDSGTRIAPLWWQSWDKDRKSTVAFPLYWHFANAKEKSSTTLAGPFYFAKRDQERTYGILPLTWYTSNPATNQTNFGLVPLFYSSRTPSQRTFLTLPFGFKTAPDKSWFYVGPLLINAKDKASQTSTWVVPPLLFYSKSSPERSMTTLAMLFWHKSSIVSSTTLALPFFYDVHSYHQSRFTMLLPLFARYRNDTAGQTYTVAPLFYRRSGPQDSTTIAFPLFWRFAGVESTTTVFFPFYVGVKRPTFDIDYVFPNVYHRKGLGSAAGTSHLFVFPFWESEVKRPGDYMWEVLLGIVGGERIGRNRFLKVLFIPFELKPAPAAQTAWYGKPPKRKAHERAARGLDIQTW